MDLEIIKLITGKKLLVIKYIKTRYKNTREKFKKNKYIKDIITFMKYELKFLKNLKII